MEDSVARDPNEIIFTLLGMRLWAKGPPALIMTISVSAVLLALAYCLIK